MDEKSKSILGSKTVWVNLLLASAVEFYPKAGVWVAAHPQTAVLAIAFLGVTMRHLTAGGLHLIAKKDKIS